MNLPRCYRRRRRLGNRSAGEAVDVNAIPFLTGDYKEFLVTEMALSGDAPKSYVVFRDGGGFERQTRAYIAKAPRKEGPIECVTEYLISRVGRQLPLRVAEGELVRLRAPRGGLSPIRFMSRMFLNRAESEQIVHGSQLVAGCFELQEQGLTEEIGVGDEWKFYTVDLIDEVFRRVAPADHERMRASFCRMIAFDALVGANDRHPQNWGIVKSASEEGPIAFAPVFDTARGLFWNHTEEKLLEKDEDDNRMAHIESYAEGSKTLIGFPNTAPGAKAPNHFDLMGYMASRARPYRASVVAVLLAFSPDRFARMLHLEFGRLLTRRRLEYIDALLRFRHARLKKVCGL